MGAFKGERHGMGDGDLYVATRTRAGGVAVKALLLVSVAVVLIASVNFGAVRNAAAAPRFSDWSAPVSLGPAVNTVFRDAGPGISKDGRSLYFTSFRPDGFGMGDIWVSQRAGDDDPWGPPENLGPTINTAVTEAVPAFSRDGHWMFFNRLGGPGGLGGFDIWVSYRERVHDDFDWQTPTNLGAPINSPYLDAGPSYFENDDAGSPLLYFGSDRPGGLGGYDIYVSAQQPDGSWGTPAPVTELNSPDADQRPNVRSDGLELYFFSNRPGGLGLTDVWVSTRGSTSDPWSPPTNLGAGVNTPQDDFQAYLSSDRLTLIFASARPGGLGDADLWMTTRSHA